MFPQHVPLVFACLISTGFDLFRLISSPSLPPYVSPANLAARLCKNFHCTGRYRSDIWLVAQCPGRRNQGPLIAYVGTFSSPLRNVRPTQVDLPPGNGRGIHLFQVDRATGALSPSGVIEQATSPSCLAINAAGTRIYSANETDKMEDGESGSISAFAINRSNGQLTLLNTVSSGGAGPTYLSIHPSGRFVLVANYFGGSVAVIPILPDGKLGPASDVKKDVGTVGPKKATNAPPGSFAISGHDSLTRT